MTVYVREQHIVDKLWKAANEVIETYDGEPYVSLMLTRLKLISFIDEFEFWSDAYDEDIDAIHHYVFTQTKEHPKSPYKGEYSDTWLLD